MVSSFVCFKISTVSNCELLKENQERADAEKKLKKEKLRTLRKENMERMRQGSQPYYLKKGLFLVYLFICVSSCIIRIIHLSRIETTRIDR